MNLLSAFLGLAVMLAACSSTPPSDSLAPGPDQQVRPIGYMEAATCKYLDDVTGSSGLYGLFAEQGTSKARASALEKAAALGANALMWSSPVNGHGSTSVTAKAYRCPS